MEPAVAMVAEVAAEFRAALALLTQASQPLAALVVTVKVFPLVDAVVVDKLAVKVSAVPPKRKVKVGGTVAVTVI